MTARLAAALLCLAALGCALENGRSADATLKDLPSCRRIAIPQAVPPADLQW